MKSKIALLSVLTCAFAQATPVSVTLGVAGGVAHGGMRIVKGDPFAHLYKKEEKKEGDKKDDKKDEEKGRCYTKNSFGLDVSADFMYHKHAFGFGVKAGMLLGFGKAKADLSNLAEYQYSALSQDELNRQVDAKAAADKRTRDEAIDRDVAIVDKDAAKAAAGQAILADATAFKETHALNLAAIAQKDSKEYSLSSGLLSSIYVGPAASYTAGKFSANLMLAVSFSSLNVEQKAKVELNPALKVEKFSKTFVGFGPKLEVAYALNSSLRVFAAAAFLAYPNKEYKKDEKATVPAKKELEVQHKNVLFFGAGVKFDVVKA